MNNPADPLASLQLHSLTNDLKLWCEPKQIRLTSNNLIIQSIDQCGSDITQASTQILKTGIRRHVIRVNTSEGPLVIKSFPFTKLKEKLKYKKYGLAEISNNIKARQLGIPAPHYYAYFESRRFGLVTANGCIMNFLCNQYPLEDICKNDNKLLYIAIPVLTELFKKGVNHIDISPTNIFFTGDKTNFCIIDWQYCSFHKPNDPLQLVVQAAHFLRGIKTDLNHDLRSKWLAQLYQSSNPDISKHSFLTAISTLQSNKLSIKDRLALNFDRATLFGQ